MGKFTVGTAQLDITPALGCHIVGYFNDRIADNIHDPLFVKAISISDGEREIGLITLDLTDISRDTAAKAKDEIFRRTGVSAEKVLISCTHTHTGGAAVSALGTPEEPGYADSLVPKIADAFIVARSRRVPSEIAHASGDVHEEVHNRRWHMKDGTTVMNPGFLNPDAIGPAGPVDPQLGLLIARDPVTKVPQALYANLALHYVGSDEHTWISADYFGYFASAMQRIAGAEFLVAMANGTQGNINNLDFKKPARTSRHAYQQCERVANVVAAEAWRSWNLLRDEDFKEEGTVDSRLAYVPFHSRRPEAKDLEEARKIYADKEHNEFMPWLYARELVLLAESQLDYEVPVQSLRVNDLGIAGLHGEVFVEFGLEIKERSPFPQTMVVGLANGSTGYIATDKALDEGSYETRLCRHVHSPKGTGKLWADTVIAGFNEMLEADK
ncbi:MAG: hypothetical protein J5833_05140 [Victivallales bacterium]|nr:hypothetical protein [Victivallales bacterium]